MAIKSQPSLAPWWYTPEQDEGEKMTRFKIKPLNGLEKLDIAGELGSNRFSSAQKVALRLGLVDWENLDDPNGQPVDFKPENFQLLGVDLLADLAQVIIKGTVLSEEQTKN